MHNYRNDVLFPSSFNDDLESIHYIAVCEDIIIKRKNKRI